MSVVSVHCREVVSDYLNGTNYVVIKYRMSSWFYANPALSAVQLWEDPLKYMPVSYMFVVSLLSSRSRLPIWFGPSLMCPSPLIDFLNDTASHFLTLGENKISYLWVRAH